VKCSITRSESVKKILVGIICLSCAGIALSVHLCAAWFSLESGSMIPSCLMCGDTTRSCVNYLWSAGSLAEDIPLSVLSMFMFIWILILSALCLVSSLKSSVFEKTFLVSSVLPSGFNIAVMISMFAVNTSCGVIPALCIISCAAAGLAVRRYVLVRKLNILGIPHDNGCGNERFTAAVLILLMLLLAGAVSGALFGAKTWIRVQETRGDLLRERVRSLRSAPVINEFPRSMLGRGGGEDAKIVISVFSDPFCPACLSFYKKEDAVISRYGKLVRFDHFFLPLDRTCNAAVRGKGHQYACEVSMMGYAAAKTGKYELFIERHLQRLDRIKKMFSDGAKNIEIAAIYTDPDSAHAISGIAESDECVRYLKRDIDFAHKAGIKKTPTVFIQGRKLQSPLTEELIFASVDEFLNSP